MSDPIQIPNLEFPGMVDPRSGALSAPLIDFLRALAAVTTDAVATVALDTLIARVVELEANADPDLRFFGTNGIGVFYTTQHGWEVRGSGVPAKGDRGPTGRDGEDAEPAWPMPGLKGDKGDPGITMVLREDADAGEPWPMVPPIDMYAEFTARSLTTGVKTIPAGYGLYVIGPYEVSAGAVLEVAAGAVMEIG